MTSKTREKLLFYSLLSVLVIVRVVAIINSGFIDDECGLETYTLFASSYMADGVILSPFILLQNVARVGGGHWIYSGVAVPFILFFGKSYFSVRLASLVFLTLTYSFMYKFCKRFFSLKEAIFASLLFIVTPELLTSRSIMAQGRHFHLNLFFILCLYLFCMIKETKKTLYYLLFGLSCGLGVYFYPAFLVTVFIFGLFLFWDIDLRRPSFIYKYFIIIVLVMIAGSFLCFGSSWYNNFLQLTNSAPKGISPSGNPFLIPVRFINNFFWHMPNTLLLSLTVSPIDMSQGLLYFFNLRPINLSSIGPEIIRVIFIFAYFSVFWLVKGYFKHIIFRSPVATLKTEKNFGVPTRQYAIIFLLVHVFLYILLFSFDIRGFGTYFLPILLNVILIMAVFLAYVWQKNKYLSLSLFLVILSPGISYQLHSHKELSFKEFYKHYIYFYDRDNAGIIEMLWNKPLSIHKIMCDKFDVNICFNLGADYAGEGPDSVKSKFALLSRGNIDKLKYLYKGYALAHFLKVRDIGAHLEEVFAIIGSVDREYRGFFYIALGEHLFSLFDPGPGFNLGRYTQNISKIEFFIEEEHKSQFFEGLGGGLAWKFAVPYSPYISGEKLYDDRILNNYLSLIEKKEYRDAFLKGFFNKDIWSRF